MRCGDLKAAVVALAETICHDTPVTPCREFPLNYILFLRKIDVPELERTTLPARSCRGKGLTRVANRQSLRFHLRHRCSKPRPAEAPRNEQNLMSKPAFFFLVFTV